MIVNGNMSKQNDTEQTVHDDCELLRVIDEKFVPYEKIKYPEKACFDLEFNHNKIILYVVYSIFFILLACMVWFIVPYITAFNTTAPNITAPNITVSNTTVSNITVIPSASDSTNALNVAVVSVFAALTTFAAMAIKELLEPTDNTVLSAQYNYDKLKNVAEDKTEAEKNPLFMALIILKSKQPTIELTKSIKLPLKDEVIFETLYNSGISIKPEKTDAEKKTIVHRVSLSLVIVALILCIGYFLSVPNLFAAFSFIAGALMCVIVALIILLCENLTVS